MRRGWPSAVFRSTLFPTPFTVGLNVVIGSYGTATSRSALRVFDVYVWWTTYGIHPLDLIFVGGHTVQAVIIGFAGIAACRQFDRNQNTADDYAN